jgi:hypothetical protein
MTDWKAGDLALCVHKGPWKHRWRGKPTNTEVEGPKCGQTLRVAEVNFSHANNFLCLNFVEYQPFNSWLGYSEKAFIKVTPEEEDEFDKEIIESYKEKELVSS